MKNKIKDTLILTLAPCALVGQIVFPGAEWEKRAPEDLGLNTNVIALIGAQMEQARANGVLIYKGYLVAEWLFGGAEDRRFEVQSVSKSISSMALGVALQEGLIPSLDARVKDYFPGFNGGPYSNEITFRHLVTATSGLKTRITQQRYLDPDYMKPGLESRYHNEHSFELARALTYVFGEDLEVVLHDKVLSPIGSDMSWGGVRGCVCATRKPRYGAPRQIVKESDVPDYVNLSDGRQVRLVAGCIDSHWTARDLARVGWLYANGGEWNGRRILPLDFVRETMCPVPQPVMEYLKDPPPDRDFKALGLTYGFLWWGKKESDGSVSPVWNMAGYGGQFCAVWPEQGLVLTKLNDWRVKPFRAAGAFRPLLMQLVEHAKPTSDMPVMQKGAEQ